MTSFYILLQVITFSEASIECPNFMLLGNACEMSHRAIAFSNNASEHHRTDLNVLQQPISIKARFSFEGFINVVNQLGTLLVDHPPTNHTEMFASTSSERVNILFSYLYLRKL